MVAKVAVLGQRHDVRQYLRGTDDVLVPPLAGWERQLHGDGVGTLARRGAVGVGPPGALGCREQVGEPSGHAAGGPWHAGDDDTEPAALQVIERGGVDLERQLDPGRRNEVAVLVD